MSLHSVKGQDTRPTDNAVAGQRVGSRHSQLRNVSTVFLWTGGANVLLYIFMVAAARLLGPSDYGLFAALFGFVALLNVVFAGLQTATATILARSSDDFAREYLHRAWRPGFVATAAFFALLVTATPLTARYLHIEGTLAVVATAAIAALYLPWNVMLGAYQGSRRFGLYGALVFAQALARLLALAGFLFVRSPASLLLLVAISMLPPLAIGLGAYPIKQNPIVRGDVRSFGNLALPFRDSLRALTVALTVGFLTLGDVVLVRHLYPAEDAGLYSGMVLIGRVILFLPAAINAVLYPMFVSNVPNWRDKRAELARGLAVTVVLVTTALILVVVHPGAALRLVVGDAYTGTANIIAWYVLAASMFALASVLAFFHLARRDGRYILLLAGPHLFAQIATPLVFTDNLTTMTIALAGVGISFFLSSAVWTWWRWAVPVDTAGKLNMDAHL